MKLRPGKIAEVLNGHELIPRFNITACKEEGREVWNFSLKGAKKNVMSIYLWELEDGRVTVDEVYERLVEMKNDA